MVRPCIASLCLLLASVADATPPQAPRPPQAPPTRTACDLPNCKCGCGDGLPCVCAVEAKELRKSYAPSWVADGWWFNPRKGYWYQREAFRDVVPVTPPAFVPQFRPQQFFQPAPAFQSFGGGSRRAGGC